MYNALRCFQVTDTTQTDADLAKADDLYLNGMETTTTVLFCFGSER